MADEAAFSTHDIVRIARLSAADIINIKPQKFGGLVRIPTGTGIGVSLDRGKLERYAASPIILTV